MITKGVLDLKSLLCEVPRFQLRPWSIGEEGAVTQT
jgi:hypothetical protein